MNRELIVILKSLMKSRGYINSTMCTIVNGAFEKALDRCINPRCQVCPFGISYISAEYLGPLLIKVFK